VTKPPRQATRQPPRAPAPSGLAARLGTIPRPNQARKPNPAAPGKPGRPSLGKPATKQPATPLPARVTLSSAVRSLPRRGR